LSFAAQLTPNSSGGGGSDRGGGSSGGEGSWGGSAQLRLAALQQQHGGSFLGFSQQQQQQQGDPQQQQQQQGSPLKQASSDQQQQQQRQGQGVGRRLVSFLSGNHRAALGATGTAGGARDGSSPDDSDTPIAITRGMRQRSLSDGANMAQRYNAYKASGLLLSSPGGSGKECAGDGAGAVPAGSGGSSNAAAFQAAALAAAAAAKLNGNHAAEHPASATVSAPASASLPAVTLPEDGGPVTPQASRRRSTRELLLQYFPFSSSRRSLGTTSHNSFEAAEHDALESGIASRPVEAGELLKVTSGLSNNSLGKSGESGVLGSSKRRFIFEWVSWR
jgi:hypothetical protein